MGESFLFQPYSCFTWGPDLTSSFYFLFLTFLFIEDSLAQIQFLRYGVSLVVNLLKLFCLWVLECDFWFGPHSSALRRPKPLLHLLRSENWAGGLAVGGRLASSGEPERLGVQCLRLLKNPMWDFNFGNITLAIISGSVRNDWAAIKRSN